MTTATPPPANPQTLASWLREQRLTRKWSAYEMARQLHQAAKTNGDHTTTTTILASYIYRWESGRMGISERYRLHYCTALDIPLSQFGPPEPPPQPASPPPTTQPSPSQPVLLIAVIPPGCHQITINLPPPPTQPTPADPAT